MRQPLLSAGHVWHVTHPSHEQEFLLKSKRDRLAWRYGLYQAHQRYSLCVFAYMVTSNHIHLLVKDPGEGETSPSMRLIAGRTAQAYLRRKGRKGPFWPLVKYFYVPRYDRPKENSGKADGS